jgi:hypothetical protein
VQSGVELPYDAVRHQTADLIRFVLHLERRAGVRRVRELLRIVRYDERHDRYDVERLFGT